MSDNQPPITIVGCGPGSPDYLTDAARAAVATADIVLGSKRLLAMFSEVPPEKKEPLPGGVDDAIARLAAHRETGRTLALLVSGDPGLCSLAQPVLRRFGRGACRLIAGVSSVQAAFARLGLEWRNARILSVHGREPPEETSDLAACAKIAVLAGTREAMRWCGQLAEKLAESHRAVVCENLTLPEESIRELSPEAIRDGQFANLSIVLLIAWSEPW